MFHPAPSLLEVIWMQQKCVLMIENQKDAVKLNGRKNKSMKSHYPDTAINIMVYIFTVSFLGLYE